MRPSWFDQLEGQWQLRRRILNLSERGKGEFVAAAAGAPPVVINLSGHLVGTAVFTRIDAATMAYVETGELVLRDGTRLKAVRRYLYRLEEDGSCLIEFADGPDSGRRFLRFTQEPVGQNAWEAGGSWTVADDHLCGRDLYQAEYRFSGFTAETFPKPTHEASGGLDKNAKGTQGRDASLDGTRDQTQAYGRRILLQRTVVSGPRKDYAIVSRLQR